MTAPRGAGADGRGADDDPAMMRSMPSTRRTTATTSAAKRATASAIQTRLQIAYNDPRYQHENKKKGNR